MGKSAPLIRVPAISTATRLILVVAFGLGVPLALRAFAEPAWTLVLLDNSTGSQNALGPVANLEQCRRLALKFNSGRESLGAPLLDHRCERACGLLERMIQSPKAGTSASKCIIARN